MKTKTWEKLANGFLIIGASPALMAIGSGLAHADEATGKISVVATLNDGPAMRAVHWKLKQNGKVVRETRSHSATWTVPTGNYTAELLCPGANTPKRQPVTVSKDASLSVVQGCD